MSIKKVDESIHSKEVTKEQLVADFKIVIADAEALLKATANSGGEAVAKLRDKTARSLSAAKSKVLDVNEAVIAKGKDAVRATDNYVQDNPWKTAGISAGIGLIVGLLIANKNK